MEPVAAWYVGNILLARRRRRMRRRGRSPFKTGTSYGYRDAWSVGFDGKRTVGVWVGRPDGAPVPGLVGRSAAAPILFDAFARSGKPVAPLPPAPQGTLIATMPSCRDPCNGLRKGGRSNPPRQSAADRVSSRRCPARTRRPTSVAHSTRWR